KRTNEPGIRSPRQVSWQNDQLRLLFGACIRQNAGAIRSNDRRIRSTGRGIHPNQARSHQAEAGSRAKDAGILTNQLSIRARTAVSAPNRFRTCRTNQRGYAACMPAYFYRGNPADDIDTLERTGVISPLVFGLFVPAAFIIYGVMCIDAREAVWFG